jgi:hypothetical protein
MTKENVIRFLIQNPRHVRVSVRKTLYMVEIVLRSIMFSSFPFSSSRGNMEFENKNPKKVFSSHMILQFLDSTDEII